MTFPRRYDVLKASQAGIFASCGKANLYNHGSNHPQAFHNMLKQLSLMMKALLNILLLHGKSEDDKRTSSRKGDTQ